jgi:drug/metabolite transporter (DMT)-like permease
MNWVLFVAVSGFFSGLTNLAFKQMANASASAFAVAAFFMMSGLMMTGYAICARQQELPLAAWKYAALAAALFTINNVFLYKSLTSGGPAGLVYGIYGAVGLAVVGLLGFALLGEKLNMYGWAGMALAVVAVVLLANGKG